MCVHLETTTKKKTTRKFTHVLLKCFKCSPYEAFRTSVALLKTYIMKKVNIITLVAEVCCLYLKRQNKFHSTIESCRSHVKQHAMKLNLAPLSWSLLACLHLCSISSLRP